MADEKPQEEPKEPPKQFARNMASELEGNVMVPQVPGSGPSVPFRRLLRNLCIALGLSVLPLAAVAATLWYFGRDFFRPEAPPIAQLIWFCALLSAIVGLIIGRRVWLDLSERRGTLRLLALASQALAAVAAPATFVLVVPSFLEACIRADVSRVRTDLRSVDLALRAYHADHLAYPAATTGTASVNGVRSKHPELLRLPSFHFYPDTELRTMNRPLVYTYMDYPSDPFAPEKGAVFIYYASKERNTEGWILTSAGPDRDYDVDPLRDYDPAIKQPSALLLGLSYDPTNGTLSNGDLWRVRQ